MTAARSARGRFAMLGLPPRLLGAVVLIEVFALGLLAVDLVATAPAAYVAALPTAGALVGAALLQSEISLRIERIRKRVVRGTANIDLSSVWTFAAAAILPPIAACAVVTVIYAYLHWRVWRPARVLPYREVFNAATVFLAVHAAAGVIGYVGFGAAHPFASGLGPLAMVMAVLAYTVVNTCLVVGAVVMSSNASVRQVLGHGDEVVLEVATLSLGGLTALAMSAGGVWLAAFALPPVLVLHRAVLVKQLEKAANIDGKTGLLTAAAWHQKATEHLQRAHEHQGCAGVLILDLDHFKRVNDDYGHLAGDHVLRSVADTIREEVRDHDLVGRFGGEEFVMLLPHPESRHYEHADLRAVAERIRRAVSRLTVEVTTPDGPLTIGGLSISIGGALYPADGNQVQDLVAVADSALYAAKRDGRNVVRLGNHHDRTLPVRAPVTVEGEIPRR